MNVIIGVIVAWILNLLKDLYLKKKNEALDKNIKAQQEKVNEVMEDFNKSYADFQSKLEQYRRESTMRASTGPVRTDAPKEQFSDPGTEKTDRDPGTKN